MITLRILRVVSHIKKLAKMPRDYAVMRLEAELGKYLWRRPLGYRERHLDEQRFLRNLAMPDFDALQKQLQGRSHPSHCVGLDTRLLEEWLPGEAGRIVERAEAVLAGNVCLLGSGTIQLGNIDWYRDYKSGLSWPMAYFTDIDVADLDRPGDVKFPWELSRMQWLIPAAQAWQITREDRYAAHVRALLEQWIDANPCAWGVNWACTMEPAMRVFTWSWLYRVLANSPSWHDREFKLRFLRALYLHLQFIRQNLEISDVNGNHLIADAAALVAGGAFFGSGSARQWMDVGWRLLKREIQLQVFPDGVDFEGSVPYHRLVTELLFYAAAAFEEDGVPVPASFRASLLRMADYISAYTKPDGEAPIFGDADDARVLPLGGQGINDHRYLPNLIWKRWAPEKLTIDWQLSASESLWWWGMAPVVNAPPINLNSVAFLSGGNYILRSGSDYVFMDCGPLGLADRGGHGHNDCLSFEAALKGCSLIVDPGCYVYTADYQMRNQFRSTAVHNTPQVAEQEINRFIAPKNLWFMYCDAQPELMAWKDESEWTLFKGGHTGYQRLDPPVKVVRTLVLNKALHAIGWEDALSPPCVHAMSSSVQLASCVQLDQRGENWIRLVVDGEPFVLEWSPEENWELGIEEGLLAPSYGVLRAGVRLVWGRAPGSSSALQICLYPGDVPNVSLRKTLFQKIEKVDPQGCCDMVKTLK